jgi:hypothetical protein
VIFDFIYTHFRRLVITFLLITLIGFLTPICAIFGLDALAKYFAVCVIGGPLVLCFLFLFAGIFG